MWSHNLGWEVATGQLLYLHHYPQVSTTTTTTTTGYFISPVVVVVEVVVVAAATLSPPHNLKISATSQESKLIGGTNPPKTQSGSKIIQLLSKLSPPNTFEKFFGNSCWSH